MLCKTYTLHTIWYTCCILHTIWYTCCILHTMWYTCYTIHTVWYTCYTTHTVLYIPYGIHAILHMMYYTYYMIYTLYYTYYIIYTLYYTYCTAILHIYLRYTIPRVCTALRVFLAWRRPPAAAVLLRDRAFVTRPVVAALLVQVCSVWYSCYDVQTMYTM